MNRVLLLIALSFLTICCHRNPLNVDVSGINLKLEIHRLDHELFEIQHNNATYKIDALQKKYGEFFDAYTSNILAIGERSDSDYYSNLNMFLQDSIREQTRIKIDSVFRETSLIRQKLEDAFKHYRYYFPNKTVPQIITLISGFNQSIVLNREAVGISLDNYLGEKCPFYEQLGVAIYKRENMKAEKIPTDVLYAWANSEFEFDDSKNNLLSNMVYYGKIMYFLDAMFPEEPDYLKIGYKPEKLEWCYKNEAGMWTYLIEQKLLFTTERMNIVRFIGPAPFTTTFTNESPGRTGIWLGWQIVRKYMKRNPGVTLQGLMAENDYQKILNESKYMPEY